MAGKGPQLRKGANLPKYWENYPFPEKMTITQWASKIGHVLGQDFNHPSPGMKITEKEYWALYEAYLLDLEEADASLEKAKGSMSFSEFQKILK